MQYVIQSEAAGGSKRSATTNGQHYRFPWLSQRLCGKLAKHTNHTPAVKTPAITRLYPASGRSKPQSFKGIVEDV